MAKRLLTDDSPELRASLQDLLFKDGEFRWNRLENLLRNARNSDDYDLSRVVDQTVEFLFSERGTFIRDRIADEIARELDHLGQSMVTSIRQTVQQRLGRPSVTSAHGPTEVVAANDDTWERITRIIGILQQTQGFDMAMVARMVPQMLFKSETRDMGQRIVGNLTQRALARLLRDFLLSEQTSPTHRETASDRTPKILPAAP